MSPEVMNNDCAAVVDDCTSRAVLISLTIQISAYGIAITLLTKTSTATASISEERCTYPIASISAVMIAHCAAKSAIHVEILFAVPISNSVIKRNAADDASA